MAREVRIEVPSIREAIEYCKDNGMKYVKCYEGRGTNQGRLMLLAMDESDIAYRKSGSYFGTQLSLDQFTSAPSDHRQSHTDNDGGYAIEAESKAPVGVDEPLDTVIFAICSGDKMYVADRQKIKANTTFSRNLAKRFKRTAAIKKVHMMNLHGNYYWKVDKILGLK